MNARSILGGSLLLVISACSGTTVLGEGEESGGSLEATIQEACDQLIACTPQMTNAECESQLHEGRAQSEAAGCVAEWDGVMDCATTNPGGCGPDGIALNPVCEDEEDAWDACAGPPGGACDGGGTSNSNGEVSCVMHCESFAAQCEGMPGSVGCVCTAGPRLGETFMLLTCESTELFSAAPAHCL
jgi:hypothetical protein